MWLVNESDIRCGTEEIVHIKPSQMLSVIYNVHVAEKIYMAPFPWYGQFLF